MAFFHGIQIAESADGTRPILEKSLAVIGLVATATATAGAATTALDAAFPVNQPRRVTDVRTAIARAGTGGTLRTALEAIAAQGSPIVIVNRVPLTPDPEDQEEATLGATGGSYTGVQALLAAESRLGIRPRIIGAPGLDTEAVAESLAAIAQKLDAFAYASCGGDNVTQAIAARETFSQRELMLLWPDASGWAGQAVATALGKRAMLDEQVGWHQSLSNQPVNGITGMTRDVPFDILDSSTAAGQLNEAGITTIVRSNGTRFWGNRTCSAEPLFAFETTVRTAQAIKAAIADGLLWAIDKPLTKGLARDIVETVNARLRLWAADERIMGGRCWIDDELNPPEQLATGKLVIDFDYTACAPLEGLLINQRITDRYYADFALGVAA